MKNQKALVIIKSLNKQPALLNAKRGYTCAHNMFKNPNTL